MPQTEVRAAGIAQQQPKQILWDTLDHTRACLLKISHESLAMMREYHAKPRHAHINQRPTVAWQQVSPQLCIFDRVQRCGMQRHYDHIDLRVPNLKQAEPFYELLLPALGFTRKVNVEGWLQFEAGDDEITEFFGVTESAHHVPNDNRIAFWAESNERVDQLAEVARKAGAQNMEGPMSYEPG